MLLSLKTELVICLLRVKCQRICNAYLKSKRNQEKKALWLKKIMKQPKEDTRSLATVYIHTSSLVLMTVFSLAGNSLVCLAFYRNRRLRKATNFYVLSLSVNGLIMATFGFPFVTIASGLRKWSFSANFCQFNGFISYYISGV